ncbi:DNA-binding transcriptional LysR family regulator [Luteibacter jiangsuensis]|uniref:DNA-binding transcriptional LysR family regulator n=1 Tax=Luteibacter jiangsuensis TaxID=637577 RepID=A0ABT9SX75_9GAMM|nr:LysR family transcriptional regulator [Luteibacter jiangsuensis]MDQ0008542.1 DNA-binding transcriptional LysR family regulator [Luteibacter jiangsuensis]
MSHYLSSPVETVDTLATSFSASYAGVIAFIAVVSEGSFARAADRLGIGRSAVSRSVQKLEQQVGARLFSRTTRSTALTREGEIFFENCHPGVERIAQALDDMRELRDGPPRGRLRIGAPVGFGRNVVAPLLKRFRDTFPEIAVDLVLDDHPVDFTADRVDVSFRHGRLEDSQVIARQVVPMQLFICATPDYLRAHGAIERIEDMASHRAIHLRLASGRIDEWEFKIDGRPHKTLPPAMDAFNDPDLVLQAVLDGRGIAQLAGYQVCAHLRAGRLVACLPQYAPDDRGHYICYQSRQQLPSRIRVFIDFMVPAIRALDLECGSTLPIGASTATS